MFLLRFFVLPLALCMVLGSCSNSPQFAGANNTLASKNAEPHAGEAQPSPSFGEPEEQHSVTRGAPADDTPTPTPSGDPTPTPTPDDDGAPTPTPPNSATPTPSSGATPTPSSSATPNPSSSPGATPTPSGSPNPSPSPTPKVSGSPTPSATPLTTSTSKSFIAVSSGALAATHVKWFDLASANPIFSNNKVFFSEYLGGSSVAMADVNGDGNDDIVIGAAVNGHVKVFDGTNLQLLDSYFAFSSYAGAVNVSACDFTGDGRAEVIVGAGSGSSPHVKVFRGLGSSRAEIFSHADTYPGFAGTVRVGCGDYNGDGTKDLIIGTGPGAAHMKVISGKDVLTNTLASNKLLRSEIVFPNFYGGIFVAGGDINGDGKAEVIVGADEGAAPHVVALGQSGAGASFYAFASGFRGGIRVGAVDLNGDGKDDIVVGAGAGGNAHVRAFSGVAINGYFNAAEPPASTYLFNKLAFDGFQGPVFVGGGYKK